MIWLCLETEGLIGIRGDVCYPWHHIDQGVLIYLNIPCQSHLCTEIF